MLSRAISRCENREIANPKIHCRYEAVIVKIFLFYFLSHVKSLSSKPSPSDLCRGLVDGQNGGSEVETEVTSDAGDEVESVEDHGLLGQLLDGLRREDSNLHVESVVSVNEFEEKELDLLIIRGRC